MPKKGGKGGKKAKNAVADADADVPTEQMIFTEAQDDAIDKKIDDKAKEQLQEINDIRSLSQKIVPALSEIGPKLFIERIKTAVLSIPIGATAVPKRPPI